MIPTEDIEHHNINIETSFVRFQAEILDLTVCIVVNGEKFQSHAVTLSLIGKCPMSNSSKLFSYATIYSNCKFLD